MPDWKLRNWSNNPLAHTCCPLIGTINYPSKVKSKDITLVRSCRVQQPDKAVFVQHIIRAKKSHSILKSFTHTHGQVQMLRRVRVSRLAIAAVNMSTSKSKQTRIRVFWLSTRWEAEGESEAKEMEKWTAVNRIRTRKCTDEKEKKICHVTHEASFTFTPI